MSPTAETYICCICDEQVDDSNSSECSGCGQRYHLNQRNDRPGKDCGDVWINDYTLALEFGCQTCIDAIPAEEPSPVANPAVQAFISQLPPDMIPDALRPPSRLPARPVAAARPERKRRYRKWE